MPFAALRTSRWEAQEPTWRAARPALIGAALERALSRPSGNWYVVGSSRAVPAGRPAGRRVGGVEVVLWRGSDGRVHAGPGACPHLGAPLCEGRVRGGALWCHWHGMRLGPRGAPGWTPFPVYDDGVLVWVRVDAAGGEAPLGTPAVPVRPPLARSVAAVAVTVGVCEPRDVVANRLDPWHGSWFHPYAFAGLVVRAASEERLEVDVSFRLGRRVGVPVRAEFTATGPRTVVMRIVGGEGAGSVVETHATPLGRDAAGRPRTAVVEAVIAHSDRSGFAAGRRAAPVLRFFMRRAAERLWRDDMAYAERRWLLRAEGDLRPR
jgi:nitrite reductase/ring-hydroxylating ferredoxin subunit